MPESISRKARRDAREAAELLDSQEHSGWRVAQLTDRNVRGAGRPGNVGASAEISMAEWVRLINRPLFAEATARLYRRVWTRYGGTRLLDANGVERSFGDHLFAARHPNMLHLLDESDESDVSAARLRIRGQEAAATVSEAIVTGGAAAVIDGLTDDQVEEVVHAAARRRPTAARAGITREMAERIPPAPFDTPPEPFAGADTSTLWMDADRNLGRWHEAMVALNQLFIQAPDAVRGRADRIRRESHIGTALADLAEGISENDLTLLLEGSE